MQRIASSGRELKRKNAEKGKNKNKNKDQSESAQNVSSELPVDGDAEVEDDYGEALDEF